MGLKPSPSGETFRFYNFCPFEVWNTFWLWLSFLVLRVVMRCATDWNALDNPSLINCRGRYCVRSLVRIGLQSVAHETSPNLPASAGSGSVHVGFDVGCLLVIRSLDDMPRHFQKMCWNMDVESLG